jgi:predicted PurR-regulated permease PerM
MISNRFYSITLTFLVLALGYLSYQVLKPFLSPIAWAVVLSLVFYPVYAFILKYIKLRSAASLITLAMILLIIIGPFSYLSFLLVAELKSISEYVEGGRLETMQKAFEHPIVRNAMERITASFDLTEEELTKTVISNISQLGKELVIKITKSMGDIVTAAVNFIFMAFAIFFLLKDGTGFVKRIHEYLPFQEEQKNRLETQVRDIIVSTVYGGVAVAVIQGIIGGIAYYFLDVPSPVFWGLSTAVASFIPLIGAFAVWGPATIYLFIQGTALKALVLAIVGVFGISMIDNILRPIIIGGRTKMPILVIFFSALGGIKLFGLIGLIMGPLVLAVFVSVIEIFRSIELRQDS